MSYLVLARKYRPQTFNDVVGQVPVVKTLRNSLLRKRVAHAILFSGVRGVGKTTLARIMAKAINCTDEGDEKPCNSCRSCKEISTGQSLDLHEIDGASNRGIQEIRELKEKIRFLPTTSRYKIIIIDEVHMLTTEAFNALLKTLEEPPEHVYFMFATTELHKIPITILSRCQRYELKRITAAELTAHFQKIADSEKVTLDPAALAMIVREAEGSVRDGLSLLDQMFSFGEKTISREDVIQVLGLTDRNVLLTITEALLSEDRSTALKALEGAFDYGIDIKRFTADLLECFRTLLLIRLENCQELIDLPEEEISHFQNIAQNYSFVTIHQKLELLMKAAEELRFSSQPRLALETAFLKIIEAGNVIPVNTLIEKINDLLSGLPQQQESPCDSPPPAQKKTEKPEPAATKATAPVLQSPDEPPLPEEPPPDFTSFHRDEQVTETSAAVPGKINEQVEVEPPLPAAPSPESPPQVHAAGSAPHSHSHDVRKDWMEFMDYVKERKVWMSQDLQRADSAKEVDGELHLHYTDPTICTLLRNKENRKLLTEFVLDFFQKELTVRFILPQTNGNGDDDDDPTSPHRQRRLLAQDPLVQMAVEIFNGQVGDIRIGPRSR
ncbi:MAG: DNA polymerase III subunit gamma/tau [Desulfopila sp.]|jgi:DNA polymerase-3 subunit gamma/tau|nr:DNA polymerase III subunit gamma/tau [Desulfopila sp.]